jgi:hypothetical protein
MNVYTLKDFWIIGSRTVEFTQKLISKMFKQKLFKTSVLDLRLPYLILSLLYTFPFKEKQDEFKLFADI